VIATQLASWNDGPTTRAIVDIVHRVCDQAGPDYAPPAERIAVFDNDGTLWCEKPLPIQLDFILRRLVAMAEKDPTLRAKQPWKAAWEKDYGWLAGAMTKHYQGDDAEVKVLLGGVLAAFAGQSVEEFDAAAEDFLRGADHPTLRRPYLGCAYQPMIDLLRYLEAHGFATFIASGGGRDFMRPLTQELYGISRERVIGSSVALRYVPDGNGGGTLVHLAEPDIIDDGPAKPVRIWSRVGRRPLLAFGNSNGDFEMLEYARYGVLVLHDDGDREFAYESGAERALAAAPEQGWVVVSMKNDWRSVFAATPPAA
jgi:phosphoserine phosphatase